MTQRLGGERFDDPTVVVRHLLAVQSQDYPGAKWGVGQRVDSTTDAEIDRLFDAGAIVRTHVMRPTWHFVDPLDLRWLLALTAPRVHQVNGYQYRQLGIDREVAARSRRVIERALLGGRALIREEIGQALSQAGIDGVNLRGGYLIIDAELEGLICSGPRRGRRQTYALLEERIPPSRPRERDEALAELARRYVEGHGPAQAADLAWWSGLTVSEARTALGLATPPLERETIEERAFWSSPSQPVATTEERPSVRLLPNYDELLVAFRDRSDAMDPDVPPPARVAAEILNHVVVRDGLVVGGWRRSDDRATFRVEANILVGLDSAEREAFEADVQRLGAFLRKPVEVTGLD